MAQWTRDLDVVWRGIGHWYRADPTVLTVLAGHVEDLDGRMARELRDLHVLLTSNKEPEVA